MNIQELETEIFCLDLRTRALLAEKLILSIDAPSEEENLQLWVSEAERRLAELRTGSAREIPAADVIRDIRAAIS